MNIECSICLDLPLGSEYRTGGQGILEEKILRSICDRSAAPYSLSHSRRIMEIVESHELPDILTQPPLTRLSSAGLLDENSSGINVQQELPPVDGGRKAWSFCVAAFVLEALVWGFGFTCVN